MSSNNNLLFLFIFFSLLASRLSAQSTLDYQWYINANVGLSQLYGDIQNENNHFGKLENETDLGFGARLGKYVSPVFAVHLQFLNSRFKGQKESSDIQFQSDLFEYQLGTTVNFSNLFGKKARRLSIYGTTGIGAIFFRSEATRISSGELVNDYGYSLDDERSKTSRESAIIIPLGAGLDIKLIERLYLNLESVLRLTNTDKLDGVESGSGKDAYYYTSLGISYNFGKKEPKEIVEPPPPEITETELDVYANEYVNLIYDLPVDIHANDTIVMNYEIHKGKINGSGELTQILPIGFNLLDTVFDNARMEFNNYTLNLYWDELPIDSVFNISYRVSLNNIYGTLPISSILYFDKTGKQYKYKTDIFINRIFAKTEPVEEEPEPDIKDVEFRVQVRAAYEVKIPMQSFATQYNIENDIKEDYVGNWYKYTVGSFESYEDAKEFRKSIVNENGVRDAFLVAYYNGKRLNSMSELKEVAPEAYPGPRAFKENGTYYRVQVLALMRSKVAPETLKEVYNLDMDVHEEIYRNWRKYTVGRFTSKNEAMMLRQKLVDQGIIDAFVVIYKNGDRVTYNGHLK